ncbi:phage tail protein [Pseudomonas typographi]|nr:phage tail protein [Pseudomonas typographi]MBD1590265.1 phage tail protein [Pseudomonas typographi]
MPWYRSGTVSCTQNSTTVTGTGTDFAANSRVGDAFLGPDGNWYEVANIASATVLSILPAYQGASVDAGSYALAPMQGYVKDSADQLRSLVSQFGSLAADPSINALEALTGAADKLAYFTAADAMALADFPAQARTLLAANSQANQRSALGLGSAAVAAILGTVSQSGGVPTGAIIEQGSNSAGNYVRFADGTQICWGVSSGATANNATGNGLYYSGLITVGFAAAFSSTPILSGSTTAQTGAMSWLGFPASYGTSAGYLSLISFGSNATATLQWMAVGRWF